MSAPLVTIGITAFNAISTIKSAVKSAINQDWENTEIVIIDDVSTDGTMEVLEELKKDYPLLRIFKNHKNGGVGVSRNKIIENAKGEFIVFFDDDDTSVAERISKQYKRIVQYETKFAMGDPVICHTARNQIYLDRSIRYEPTMGMAEGEVAPNGYQVAERTLTGKPFPNVFGSTATCSQMARSSVYRALGGFDIAFKRSEDTEFNVRLSLAKGHFVGIAEPLVTQTMTLSSEKNLDDERDCILRLLEKHKKFIDNKSSYIVCYKWMDAKFDFLSKQKGRFIKKIMILFFKYPVETSRRIYWALPNLGFNINFSKFHNDPK